MIYIDPPYNTGGDGFIYNDDRKFTKQQLSQLAGVDEDEAQRILDFTQSNSNSHSAWLTFMYPRLYIAKELLRDDGVIFISIDDNEQAQLKQLCDEVFGEENFVTTIPWRKRTAKSDVPFGVSQDYEWLICYAKSSLFTASTQGKERIYHETDDFPGRPWRTHDLTTQRNSSERPNCFFTLINPKNGEEFPANSDRTWAVSKDTFQEYYDFGKIIFPNEYVFLNIKNPVMRYFKDDDEKKSGKFFGRVAVSTKLPDAVGMSEGGTKEITALFDQKIFSFPKPSSLIKFLISVISPVVDKEDILLDFFAGSGTTAHAVMALNAEDGGNRQCISVQLDEPCDPKSEAYKAGYKTIFDICKARIEKAAEKIQPENPEYEGDLGFKVFKTVPLFEEKLNEEDAKELAQNLELFDGSKLSQAELTDVLTTYQVYDQIPLTQSLDVTKVDEYVVHWFDRTVYLIDKGFDSKALRALIQKYDEDEAFSPSKLVIFGHNFESKMLREIGEAFNSYRNKKAIDIDVIVRY